MTLRKIKKFPLYTEKTFFVKAVFLYTNVKPKTNSRMDEECNNKKWVISGNAISGNPYPLSELDKLILLGWEIRNWSFLSQIRLINILGHLMSKVPQVKKGG